MLARCTTDNTYLHYTLFPRKQNKLKFELTNYINENKD